MNKKCPKCKLVNFSSAHSCARCDASLVETENITVTGTILKSTLLKRAAVCLFACAFVLTGFYISLVLSAKSLEYEERKSVERAVKQLDEKGFTREAFLLNYLTVFRSNDNWLNASVEKENAYAATNFPFEIMTLYPDFFTFTGDDTERAAILLHEARHLQGDDEKEAYEFVWKNRKILGWTSEKYKISVVWINVRKQTREYSPNLFVCDFKDFGDCTE